MPALIGEHLDFLRPAETIPRPAGVTGDSIRVLGLGVFTLALALGLLFPPPGQAASGPSNENRVATPAFTVPGGLIEGPVEVTLFTATPQATVLYTTNGAIPTLRSGIHCTGPVRLAATTVLRAAAFRDGFTTSESVTRTWIQPTDVIHQGTAPSGFPSTWGSSEGRPVRADYEMDPEIVKDPAYRDEILPALRSLPSISLVCEPDDLFDPRRGIYANPMESGVAWERPVAVEYFEPGSRRGFSVNAGLRIQGGWNRRPEESPKHAFRLVFRKRYGPGKLHAPVFDEPGPEQFDELVLRAGCNNTWLHWSGEERRRGDFIRDQWMRDTCAAMGHASARGRFVHLYLNGLYWGLYNVTERPAGPFVALRFGGAPANYDVRNGANLLEGDDLAWQTLGRLNEAGLAAPERLEAIRPLIDLTQFSDYLLLNLYGANGDWDGSSNWYAARRRQPPGPFQFFVWDGERTLEGVEADTLAYDATNSPPHLFQKLRANPEFRRLFAERARRHLTGDGVLTPKSAAARYERWSRMIDRAVVAESARWGDYRRDAHPYRTGPYELYTRNDHWRPEVRRLLDEYFPRRTAVVIRQLQAAGLYP